MKPSVEAAYAACEAITKVEARNFHYGIRLLPQDKRSALSAVYALARRIDDIGDGDLPVAAKRAALVGARASLDDLGGSDDPVLVAVADASRRMPIPIEAFGELVDGVEMDVAGTRFETFDDLVGYCRNVAGSIGRLCLGVFGARDMSVAPGYADELGIALQQTNILRDIREDLTVGRVYLPTADLMRFGVELKLGSDGALVDDGGLTALVRFSADRARSWYDDGLRLIPLLDRRSAACASAMAGIYRKLLDRIAAQPSLVRDRRPASRPGLLPDGRYEHAASRSVHRRDRRWTSGDHGGTSTG
jgi:phytoene synthase